MSKCSRSSLHGINLDSIRNLIGAESSNNPRKNEKVVHALPVSHIYFTRTYGIDRSRGF